MTDWAFSNKGLAAEVDKKGVMRMDNIIIILILLLLLLALIKK